MRRYFSYTQASSTWSWLYLHNSFNHLLRLNLFVLESFLALHGTTMRSNLRGSGEEEGDSEAESEGPEVSDAE